MKHQNGKNVNITRSVMPIWHITFGDIALMMLEYIKLTLRLRKVGKTSKPNLKVCAAVYFKANTIIESFDNNCMTGIAIGMFVF